ncbi:MAG TPA: helix-hairpin-helix domain-containing protein [Gemmatimonadales bacterium]|nr:helix-hairpin-helix domain-containing protein [Gemmatimonadales bacterium]
MPSERRALLLLLSLAVAGQGVRYLVTRPGAAPGDVHILDDGPDRSPQAQAHAAVAALEPLKPGERIDADAATAQALARLPRVGLSLAKRIVADRDSNGPFGSLQGLDRVPGIGAGLLKVLGPHLSFSGSPAVGRPDATSTGNLTVLPSYRPTVLNVNTATAAELEHLPLIGPSRALAIVAWRTRHGSFQSEADLVHVPGVSQRMVAAIRERIAFH